jgi:hypothetical protein
MNPKSIHSHEAASIFVDALLHNAYIGTIRAVERRLQAPLPGRPEAEEIEQQRWYATLGEESRAHVDAVIRYAVDLATFSCCTIIDGASGGYPVPETESEWALYLQFGSDTSASEVNVEGSRSVRVNAPDEEDLHDMFVARLEEFRRNHTAKTGLQD